MRVGGKGRGADRIRTGIKLICNQPPSHSGHRATG